MQTGIHAVSDLTMKPIGDLTAQVRFDGVHVTTTEDAPKNAILLHPETLHRFLDSTDGTALMQPYGTSALKAQAVAADAAVGKVPTPITVQETSVVLQKFLEEGVEALNLDEVAYLARVTDLPEDDISRRLLDVVSDIRAMVDNKQVAQAASTEPTEAREVHETTTTGLAEAKPVCVGCLNKLEGVFNTVKGFVDEYGISGPGYVDINYEKDVATNVTVLTEALERFKANETDNRSPSFKEALTRSLAIEVARNMIYEKLILDLAGQVGFAEDDTNEEGFADEDNDRGVRDSAA